jgi:signal transduction histidine kinase
VLSLFLVLLLAAACLVVSLLLLRVSRRREALLAAGALTALGLVFPQTLPALVADSTAGAVAVGVLELAAGAAFMAWLLTFPDGRFEPRWSVVLVGALATGQLGTWLDITLPSTLSTALSLATLVLVIAVLTMRLRRLDGASRTQAQLVAGAFAIASAALVAAEIAQEIVGVRPGTVADLTVQSGLVLAFLTVPVSVAAATLRRGLYDVGAAIGRATTYAFLGVGAVSVHVLIVAATAGTALGHSVAGVVAAGAVAVMVLPAYRWLRRLTNRALYGLRDEPGVLLARLAGGVAAGTTPGATLEATVIALAESLRIPHAAVVLPTEDVARPAGPPPGHWPVEEVPLVHQGREVGRLRLAARDPDGRLSAGDHRALALLLPHLAALAHADELALHLERSHRDLVSAREEERRRLRNDLHDELGPTLSSVRLTLAAAANHLRDRPEVAAEHLATARSRLGEAVADVRRLVYGLRPPALDQLGLLGAVEAWSRSLPTAAPLIEVEGPPSLQPGAAVEVAAYRIVLEAVTNVLRHADATRCRIRFATAGADLVVAVEDDGRGAEHHWTEGVGLRSMRDRVAEVGGRLEIATAPSGTSVTAVLPAGGDLR